ncbi:MAG: hypothetical protein BWY74_01693 [Firmicutes bacterium ADurb.Bin419]|nr:MAG: hypothetical protein BWY74_01693 [Firmicutes bacterium ADurb.Bin419]
MSGGYSSDATYTLYFYNSTAMANIIFTPTSTFDGSIDDVTLVAATAPRVALTAYSSDGNSTPPELRPGGSGKNNTLIGRNAGIHANVGSYNTHIGSAAGSYNAGSYNTAIGANALASAGNVTGGIALGYGASQQNRAGNYCISLGYYAGRYNRIGTYNVAIGYNALAGVAENSNTGNVGVGARALLGITTGTYNSGYGYNSGRYVTSGSYNIGIGYDAHPGTTGSRNIIIGTDIDAQDATASGQLSIGNLILGDNLGTYTGTTLCATGRIGIGILPTARLTLPAGSATAGTAPLKLTSGTLLSAPEVGATEFLTDKAYLTITTGTARKEFTLNDAALTSGRLPYVTTNGRLTDASTLVADSTSITFLSDSGKAKFGAGTDMSVYYNGTSGYIKTDEVAASDLHLTTGTAKTLVLDTVVYNEVNVSVTWFEDAPIYAPTLTLLSDDGESSIGVYVPAFSYSRDEMVYFQAELPHDYKEDTAITFHVHYVNLWTAGGDVEYTIPAWEMEYFWFNVQEEVPTTTVIAASTYEPASPSGGQHEIAYFPAVSPGVTNGDIRSVIAGRLYRDVSEEYEPGSTAYLLRLDFTYQSDTIGSRTATAK